MLSRATRKKKVKEKKKWFSDDPRFKIGLICQNTLTGEQFDIYEDTELKMEIVRKSPPNHK